MTDAQRKPKSEAMMVRPRESAPDALIEFFSRVLHTLRESGIPFMVGGAYALERHTGIGRDTRDFDVFVLEEDAPRILELFEREGYQTELTHPHWLGKILKDGSYVDVIYSSGNGVVRVDKGWLEHAPKSELFGQPVLLVPIEEMIWSKSFVMERERFDGGDVLHLLLAAAPQLDWARLVERFGPLWRVLLVHLLLFEFVYPTERHRIPDAVLRDLKSRTDAVGDGGPPMCLGTLLSREQYLPDLISGYRDGRLELGIMTAEEIEQWTRAGDPD
jgi:hypothetical protein